MTNIILIKVAIPLRGGSRSWQGEEHKQTKVIGGCMGRAHSLVIFEAANNHLLVMFLLKFAILAFADGCEVF